MASSKPSPSITMAVSMSAPRSSGSSASMRTSGSSLSRWRLRASESSLSAAWSRSGGVVMGCCWGGAAPGEGVLLFAVVVDMTSNCARGTSRSNRERDGWAGGFFPHEGRM